MIAHFILDSLAINWHSPGNPGKVQPFILFIIHREKKYGPSFMLHFYLGRVGQNSPNVEISPT
jgi:hypothetical protein